MTYSSERLLELAEVVACDMDKDEADAANALRTYAATLHQAARVDEGMVSEGLDYFEKAGDAGDKRYVRAIRQKIAALEAALSAQPAEPVRIEVELEREVNFLLKRFDDVPPAWVTQHVEWMRKHYAAQPAERHGSPFCGACGEVVAHDSVGRKHCACTHPAAPVGVPDGMVLVPRIPTDEMQDAFQEEQCRWSAITHVDDEAVEALWVAMLAAAAPVGVPDGMVLREVVEVAQGDLHMLKKAIEARDPWPELLFRVTDTERDLRTALAAAPSAPQGVER